MKIEIPKIYFVCRMVLELYKFLFLLLMTESTASVN
jgi:hypothetical protein